MGDRRTSLKKLAELRQKASGNSNSQATHEVAALIAKCKTNVAESRQNIKVRAAAC